MDTPRRFQQPQFGFGLLVGVSVGALLGAIVTYFIVRRRKEVVLLPDPTPIEGSVLQFAAPPPLPGPKIAAPKETVREDPQRAVPVTRSIELPAPGVDAVRLVSSADRSYSVQVRAVDPPGTFAIVSLDPNELNITAVAIPQGNNLIIPVGQWQNIPMGPHQALYGRGSVAGVTVSISGHEM